MRTSHAGTLSRSTVGVAGAAEHPAGREVSGLHRRSGRAYAGHRLQAFGSRTGDRERSRPAVSRNGAGEHEGILGSNRVSAFRIFGAESFGPRRDAGRPGSQPLSVDQSRARIFFFVGWTSGHASRSNEGCDSGRSGEYQCRKNNSRLDLPTRRRKESAEDYWSTDPRSARSEHTASGGYRGTGCTEDRTNSSRDSYFHGTEDGGQSGAGRAGRAASTRAADGSPRRAHRDHFLSLTRRPQSEKQFSRACSLRQGRFTDEKACRAR